MLGAVHDLPLSKLRESLEAQMKSLGRSSSFSLEVEDNLLSEIQAVVGAEQGSSKTQDVVPQTIQNGLIDIPLSKMRQSLEARMNSLGRSLTSSLKEEDDLMSETLGVEEAEQESSKTQEDALQTIQNALCDLPLSNMRKPLESQVNSLRRSSSTKWEYNLLTETLGVLGAEQDSRKTQESALQSILVAFHDLPLWKLRQSLEAQMSSSVCPVSLSTVGEENLVSEILGKMEREQDLSEAQKFVPECILGTFRGLPLSKMRQSFEAQTNSSDRSSSLLLEEKDNLLSEMLGSIEREQVSSIIQEHSLQFILGSFHDLPLWKMRQFLEAQMSYSLRSLSLSLEGEDNMVSETLGNVEMEKDSSKKQELSPKSFLHPSCDLPFEDHKMNSSSSSFSTEGQYLGSETPGGSLHPKLDYSQFIDASDDSPSEKASHLWLYDMLEKEKTMPPFGLLNFLNEERDKKVDLWGMDETILHVTELGVEESGSLHKTEVDGKGSLEKIQVVESDEPKPLERSSSLMSGSGSPGSAYDIILPSSWDPSKLNLDECEVDGIGAVSTMSEVGDSLQDNGMFDGDKEPPNSHTCQLRIRDGKGDEEPLDDETVDGSNLGENGMNGLQADWYYRHPYRPCGTNCSVSRRSCFEEREQKPQVPLPLLPGYEAGYSAMDNGHVLPEPAKDVNEFPLPAKPECGSSQPDNHKSEYGLFQPAKPAVVGAGLANLGKTCYMNAILQCFTHTVSFVQGLLLSSVLECGSHEGFCVLCSLRDHIKIALEHPGGLIHPHNLADNLSQISSFFTRNQEQDAHELLFFLLDKLDSCWLSHQKNPDDADDKCNESLVRRIFGGCIAIQRRCCKCGYKSDSYCPIYDLCLGVDNANLQDALKSFTKVDKIENATCDRCKEIVSKEMQHKLAEVPPVFALHLKRFKHRGGSIEKCQKTLGYPLELDLEPYTVAEETGKVELKYKLYAIVVHIGPSLESGHYVCFIRYGPGTWFMFDDSQVQCIPEEEALTQGAYILFYCKKGTPWPCNVEVQDTCDNGDHDANSFILGRRLHLVKGDSHLPRVKSERRFVVL